MAVDAHAVEVELCRARRARTDAQRACADIEELTQAIRQRARAVPHALAAPRDAVA